jgi:hypothetical protein
LTSTSFCMEILLRSGRAVFKDCFGI